MILTRQADRASLGIEDYADLLAVRALPEFHFTDERTVSTATALLGAIGLDPTTERPDWLPPADYLFDYESWTVKLALERERFAIFAMTGMGKTAMQLEWARQVLIVIGGRVLIVAPLNICAQTRAEAKRFYGYEMVDDLTERRALNEWLDHGEGVGITNYEKLDNRTEPLPITGLVLDESSVLKASMGSRRTALIKSAKGLRFKLCCSATPAPNDRLEYAEHAYFLDVVRSTREFLAAFFVNRDGEWQLKHHAVSAFYRHLAAWSVFMRDPRAYGFEDHTMDLPALNVHYPRVGLTEEQRVAARGWEAGNQPSFLGATPGGITSRTKLVQIANGFELGTPTRRFLSAKPDTVARLANVTHPDEQVLVWVNYDEEAAQLAARIPDAVVLSGKTKMDDRTSTIEAFAAGSGPRVLIAKPRMFAHGLNLQSCRIMVFSSMTDSFESWFQAIRRCHRYGQTRPVEVYVPLTELDDAICQNVLSKEATFRQDGELQEAAYVAVLRPSDTSERHVLMTLPQPEIDRLDGERWSLVQADCIAHMPTMDEGSMDLAVFSPPFANLFTYSSAAGDMGNVKSDDEYRLQWEFFVIELIRVMRPGRIVAIHAMDVIRFAGAHGYRHTYDYPSDLRAAMERSGFIYRARIAIDKNPQAQATRTKDQNLLFVTLKRDALNSHPQASECLLIFTTPGESTVPVVADDVSNQEWIAWAHHVWYDIRETDVLNASLGKEHEDERHICPLQLGLIERVVRVWSNRGETVFSPFAGIGSEGVESLRWGRRFYGIELKESYFRTAGSFLAAAEAESSQPTLFDAARASVT
jgi:DNA modification methylase/superfamily II DNA or RNA helicase